MTIHQRINLLRCAVCKNPRDLDRRLVLADAYAEAGLTLAERFWRWTVKNKIVPEPRKYLRFFEEPLIVWSFSIHDLQRFLIRSDDNPQWMGEGRWALLLRQAWDRLRKSIEPMKQWLAGVYPS